MRSSDLSIGRAVHVPGAKRWLAVPVLLVLASCAGGGGGGPSAPPGPQPQSVAFAQAGPLYKFAGDPAYAELSPRGGGGGARRQPPAPPPGAAGGLPTAHV